MAFKMDRSPKDEKLLQTVRGKQENIVTLGRGSYTSTFNLPLQFGVMNVLGGRFCSLANEIYFSIGGNHPLKIVSTYPLDVIGVVTSIFGKVRSNLKSLPNVRRNSRQIIFGNDV